jgi:hypothetical protein
MKIEVLGTGCYKCMKLETMIDEIIRELGETNFEITRGTDEKRILEFMPMDEIPGLLINGVLASTGEIPARETLVEWLSGVSMPDAALS